MPEFRHFAEAVRDRLDHITRNPSTPVFVTDLAPEELWDAYLKAFPEGTNPIFRERTEHDCACCRGFIKNLGGIVTLRPDGTYQTAWDVTAEGEYGVVAAALASLIKQHPIKSIYRTTEPSYGARVTYEDPKNGGPRLTWHHFYGTTPNHLRHRSPGEAIGEVASAHQVLGRGLEELSLSALETVEDLIVDNSLYRGEEHHQAVKDFRALKRQYDALSADRRATFVWQSVDKRCARFRNTAIGTLVQDLSEGVEVDVAVSRFESKVAPHNYRRPTALITTRMVEAAVETLRGLGLESAVRRRYATARDLSVNDVLFVDRNVRPHMKDDLTSLLLLGVPGRRIPTGGAEQTEMGAEDFINLVLPGANSVELVLESEHSGNFVSITAPAEEAGVGRLFQWDNNFAWAYDGDVADSIRQRVKAAGGNVNALLRVSLSWRNFDDLDIHCESPFGHVYFANKCGILDVDMNAGTGTTRTPVENLAFTSLRDGTYRVYVHQYNKRETSDVGFEVEYEHGGKTRRFSSDRPMATNQNTDVLTFKVDKGAVIEVTPSKAVTSGPDAMGVIEKWGVTSGQAVPVDMVLLSPNHWGEPEARHGNKHYIFVLRGCKNPGTARGFFNEFLRPDLHPHRKVFEVLGSKMMCPPSDDQLSGVGFSSTRRDRATFVVRKGDSTRTYIVQF